MTKASPEKKNTSNANTKKVVKKATEVAPVVPVVETKTTSKQSKASASTKTDAKVVPAKTASAKATSSKAAPTAVSAVEQKSSKGGAKKSSKVTKTAAKVAAVVQEVPAADKPKQPRRYFKCIQICEGNEVVCRGRYFGKKPKQAANKACTRIYKTYKQEGHEFPPQIIFGMHECTRSNPRKKKYFYIGKRVELEDALEVPIKKENGEEVVIKYNFNNDVKKLTDITCNEYNLLCKYDVQDDDEEEEKVVVKKVKKTVKAKGGAKVSKAKKVVKKESAAKTSAPKVTKSENVRVSKKNSPVEKVEEAPPKKVTKKVVKKNNDH